MFPKKCDRLQKEKCLCSDWLPGIFLCGISCNLLSPIELCMNCNINVYMIFLKCVSLYGQRQLVFSSLNTTSVLD